MKKPIKTIGKHALLLLIITSVVLSTATVADPFENQLFSCNSQKQQLIRNNQPQQTDDEWLHYDDGTNFNSIGLNDGGSFEWGIRLTPDELIPYDGKQINIIRHHHGLIDKDEPYTTSGEVRIYDAGSSTEPGALLTSEEYTVTDIGWFDVTLSEGVTIDASKDLWVTVTSTHLAGQYPAGCDPGPMIPRKGGFITVDGETWNEIAEFNLDYNWNLQAGIESSFEIISISGGIGVSSDIKNINSDTITDIDWTIKINGGILGILDKNEAGTIESMAPEGVETIKSGIFFGLGPINVTISIDSDVGIADKQTSGTIIGPFVLI